QLEGVLGGCAGAEIITEVLGDRLEQLTRIGPVLRCRRGRRCRTAIGEQREQVPLSLTCSSPDHGPLERAVEAAEVAVSLKNADDGPAGISAQLPPAQLPEGHR